MSPSGPGAELSSFDWITVDISRGEIGVEKCHMELIGSCGICRVRGMDGEEERMTISLRNDLWRNELYLLNQLRGEGRSHLMCEVQRYVCWIGGSGIVDRNIGWTVLLVPSIVLMNE